MQAANVIHLAAVAGPVAAAAPVAAAGAAPLAAADAAPAAAPQAAPAAAAVVLPAAAVGVAEEPLANSVRRSQRPTHRSTLLKVLYMLTVFQPSSSNGYSLPQVGNQSESNFTCFSQPTRLTACGTQWQ